MQKRLGDILKFTFFIGIGVFCIWWFLLKLDADQKDAIWQSFMSANYAWVGVAMLCCLLSHLLRALRWRLLYKPLGDVPGFSNTFGAVVVAYMANLAFPRLGEVMRCAVLRTSEKQPLEKSIGTVVTERLIDTLMFGLIAVSGILYLYNSVKDWLYDNLRTKFESLPTTWMILVAGVVLLVLLFLAYRLLWKRLLHFEFFRKIDAMVRGCIDGIVSVMHMGRRDTWLFLFYSVLIYGLYIMGGLIIFQAFDETSWLGWRAAFALYLFGSVGMIFSQGGIGVYPVMVQMALAIYGISYEVGTACGWLLWGSQQAITIMVGMIYLVYFSVIKKKTQQ